MGLMTSWKQEKGKKDIQRLQLQLGQLNYYC